MKYFFLLALAFSSLVNFSQETLLLQYSNSITKEELKEYVYTLASDSFAGRNTGTEGQRMAANYIRQQFSKDGLKDQKAGSDEPYLQAFELDKCYWTKQDMSAGEINFKGGEQYIFLSDPDTIADRFPVVFAGFGIDDSAYSDYKDLDVKGKVVLAFSGEPKGKKGRYLISGTTETSRKAYYFSKARTAARKGAAGLIVMARDDKDYEKIEKTYHDRISQPVTLFLKDRSPERIFSIYIPLETGASILNTSVKDLQRISRDDPRISGQSGTLKGTVGIQAGILCFPLRTENVVGIVEGTDKKTEAVVIVAHYDHLGEREGKLYPGADDNASGTAALMELAEAFARASRDGHPPRRTVIFLAVSGEEEGLYGSRYYTEHPLAPVDSTYACINIDMIGRASTKREAEPEYIGGYVYKSKDLFTLVQQYNKLMAPGLNDRMEYSAGLRGGSDHYYFAREGVPSIFYFTGIHADYHQSTDTPDKILYDRMETIVRAIFATAWALANGEEKLEVED